MSDQLNRDVYRQVTGLFTLWAEDGYRKNKYYQELCRIAKAVELPAYSPEHKIIYCAKSPTDRQVEKVAYTLAKRAIEMHFELG